MNSWVKVTELDGDVLWVNMKMVHCMLVRDGGTTVLQYMDGEEIHVRETPEVILANAGRV